MLLLASEPLPCAAAVAQPLRTKNKRPQQQVDVLLPIATNALATLLHMSGIAVYCSSLLWLWIVSLWCAPGAACTRVLHAAVMPRVAGTCLPDEDNH